MVNERQLQKVLDQVNANFARMEKKLYSFEKRLTDLELRFNRAESRRKPGPKAKPEPKPELVA